MARVSLLLNDKIFVTYMYCSSERSERTEKCESKDKLDSLGCQPNIWQAARLPLYNKLHHGSHSIFQEHAL